jgi:uncharacterized protein YecE (DUF72 family)
MGSLRIGTCSWKYPSWQGLVYSPGVTNFLVEYAQKYPTVEIDQWFWSMFPGSEPKLPDPRIVVEYADSVSPAFRFTVKAPNSITLTHPYARSQNRLGAPNRNFLSPELTRQFLATLEPMKPKLGPVIFQFEYLNRRKMESQDAFQERLGALRTTLPQGFEYALEIRNGEYLNASFLEYLLEKKWQLVLLQGYWMPSVVELWEKFADRIRQFEMVVLRLHGTDREGIEKETGKAWNRIVESREKELADIAGIVKDLTGSKNEIYVNVNNHYEGSAPLTIERFQKFINR